MGTDRAETLLKGKKVEYRYWAIYEVEVSPNAGDTVTLGEFDSTVDLDQALMVKKSDGTEISTTIDKNKVTTSGAGTNIDCVLFAFGVKA